ncbi:hypothetical protein [Rufibacter tibetensis]|uniref:Uncharacterized protein n=1 Tax=Rufibacter tibetensis TaxID=512763 RepID=A0A0P0CVJ8_9BACT|nr:hypothetical protein [Rufibacter tibetensis]ALJ00728.1 hypothetical protein DC20_19275 [Rufibacter tibetensis]
MKQNRIDKMGWRLSFLISLILVFAFVIIGQWALLKEFPDVVVNYPKYQKSGVATLGYSLNKYIGQCLFYLLGFTIFIASIAAFIRRKELSRRLFLISVMYFLVFIALEFPLYGWDIGWETVHGHSFWKGFHFH